MNITAIEQKVAMLVQNVDQYQKLYQQIFSFYDKMKIVSITPRGADRMGWVLLILSIAAMVFAIANVHSKPAVSVLTATAIPFAAFYYIGMHGSTEVFVLAAILYFVTVYIFLFRKELKDLR